MKTEDLIKDLMGKCDKVSPMCCPFRRFFYWFIFTIVYFLGIYSFTHGISLFEALQFPRFWYEFTLMALIIFCSGWLAFELVIPGGKASCKLRSVLTLFIGIWVAFYLGRYVYHLTQSPMPLWFDGVTECGYFVVLSAIVPSIVLVWMLRKGVCFKKKVLGFLIGLTPAMGAFMFLHAHCTHRDASHQFLWHFLPVIALGLIGYILGKILFKAE